MAASSPLHQATGIAQTSELAALLEQQRFWNSTSLHGRNPNVNVATGQWLSTWEGGNSKRDVHVQRERQELLWREYFRDPTSWWDYRQDRKTRFPDFRHKESNEPLWLNSFHKPAWVDAQLAILDRRTRGLSATTPASDSSLPNQCQQRQVTAQTVTKLCDQGQLAEAVQALSVLVETQSRVPSSLLHAVLKTCEAHKNLVLGRLVHDITVKIGYGSNTFLGSHILRMYARQGTLQEARNVFTSVARPDASMWSSIISAHVKHGEAQQAIQLYHEMRSKSGVKPQSYVLVAALQACASAGDLESGRRVHVDVVDSGVPPNSFVSNSLIDMYAKCGQLEDARSLFDSLEARDVVTWSAMLAGYAQHGVGQEALALYATMESKEGLSLANAVTFACLVKACASAGALQQGKQLHSRIEEQGLLESDILLGSCLVDMYAKCGEVEDARALFDSLPAKDVVTWNIMINGYGRSNQGHRAIDCFQEMLRCGGVEPNGASFACLLTACSHEGLVKEGLEYLDAMVAHHGIMPETEHYTCIVDLLGRAGRLDDAEETLSSFESNEVGLLALLNACKSHGDVERGSKCFGRLMRLDPQNSAAYVLMANIYADAGRWTDVDRIEGLRKVAGARKKPARAGIEVNRHVHMFVVGEERADVSCRVQSMNVQLKEEGGHVPHTELVLKLLLSESDKEDELCGHAEKLALAYGLLNTPDGTPLLVTKNLRMCRDCHSSTEIMSRIEGRDIVVRDAHRVHRFVGGSCSCRGRP